MMNDFGMPRRPAEISHPRNAIWFFSVDNL